MFSDKPGFLGSQSWQQLGIMLISTIYGIVIVGRRVTPVALVAGLVIMVLILLYTAFNHAHQVSPQTTHAPETNQR